MKKAVVFTLGCKVNGCESGSLARGLSERGWEGFPSAAGRFRTSSCPPICIF